MKEEVKYPERICNLLRTLQMSPGKSYSKNSLMARTSGYADSTDTASLASEDANAVRTFESDIEFLRSCGFDIKVSLDEHSSEYVYSLSSDSYRKGNENIKFSREEVAWLLGSLTVWGESQQKRCDKIRCKILGKSVESASPAIAPAGFAQSDLYYQILQAIESRQIINFRYHASSKGEITERRVAPMLLFINADRGLYLTGFDYTRNENRIFKLQRILDDEITVEAEKNAYEIDEEIYDNVDFERKTYLDSAAIALEPDHGHLLRHIGVPIDREELQKIQDSDSTVLTPPEGWDVYRYSEVNFYRLRALVAELGEHAKVCHPADLAETIKNAAESLAQVDSFEPIKSSTKNSGSLFRKNPTTKKYTNEAVLALSLMSWLARQPDRIGTIEAAAKHFGVKPKAISDLIYYSMGNVGADRAANTDVLRFDEVLFEEGMIALSKGPDANDTFFYSKLITADDARFLLSGLEILMAFDTDLTSEIVDQIMAKLLMIQKPVEKETLTGIMMKTASTSGLAKFLNQCIVKGQCISISYVNSADRRSDKEVKPINLRFHNLRWYLEAWDKSLKSLRVYDLERILSCETIECDFSPRSKRPTLVMADKDITTTQMKIRYSGITLVETNDIRRLENAKDYCTVEMDVVNVPWFKLIALRAGSNLLGVSAPKEWVKDLRDTAKAVVSLYPHN